MSPGQFLTFPESYVSRDEGNWPISQVVEDIDL